MHGSKRRELETERPGHGHRGEHTRPGNRRNKGPEPYRQTIATAPAPDPTSCGGGLLITA
jgi:hypothetical protein